MSAVKTNSGPSWLSVGMTLGGICAFALGMSANKVADLTSNPPVGAVLLVGLSIFGGGVSVLLGLGWMLLDGVEGVPVVVCPSDSTTAQQLPAPVPAASTSDIESLKAKLVSYITHRDLEIEAARKSGKPALIVEEEIALINERCNKFISDAS